MREGTTLTEIAGELNERVARWRRAVKSPDDLDVEDVQALTMVAAYESACDLVCDYIAQEITRHADALKSPFGWRDRVRTAEECGGSHCQQTGMVLTQFVWEGELLVAVEWECCGVVKIVQGSRLTVIDTGIPPGMDRDMANKKTHDKLMGEADR